MFPISPRSSRDLALEGQGLPHRTPNLPFARATGDVEANHLEQSILPHRPRPNSRVTRGHLGSEGGSARWGGSVVKRPIERRTMDAQKPGDLGHGFAGLLDKLPRMGNLLRPE